MGCSSSAANSTVSEYPLVDQLARGFFERYWLGAKIRQGHFGQVRVVNILPSVARASDEDQSSVKEKCVKIIDLMDKRCAGMKEVAAMEVNILQSIGHHPNCVELFDAYIHEDICFLVMEKCHCNLYQYMKDMPNLNERSVGKLVFQMLSGLHQLHSYKVVHRDVKPDNFLIGGMHGHTVKLCDFGLAAILPEHGRLSGPVGTVPYVSPEMILGERYDERTDIWSLAVIVYLFLFGSFPYDLMLGSMVKTFADRIPAKFEPLAGNRKEFRSEDAVNFVKALLQRSQKHRPCAADALNLPYMVLVMTHRHVKGVALPELQPMLQSARRLGAFTTPDLSRTTDVDRFLGVLQMQKTGIQLPRSWKLPVSTRIVDKDMDKESRLHYEFCTPCMVTPALSAISECTTCESLTHSPRPFISDLHESGCSNNSNRMSL